MLDLSWRNLKKKTQCSPVSTTDGIKTREAFMSNASQTGGNHFALMSSGFAQKFRAKLFFKRRDTCQHKLGSVNEDSKTEGLTFG